MDRLILARHAESVFNVRGVLNGDPSIPGGLTDNGREQARLLGERSRSERIDLCVTTEFDRTRETADVALAGRDVLGDVGSAAPDRVRRGRLTEPDGGRDG